MAGDWIKMRTDIHDDPAVVRMSDVLGLDEDTIVGKLHRLWSWADRHTIDGKTTGITEKWIDRYVAQQGFAQAMQDEGVGWLVIVGDVIEFPNFDRHNGESAKLRAENALRQRLSRKMRDKGVTGIPRTVIPRPFVRAVMERDCFTCVYCGSSSDAEREASRKAILSVDHLSPNSRGGKTAIHNLVCCCRLCNREKNDRTPEEWDILPTFLAAGYEYSHGLVTKTCDKSVTRVEERRGEKSKNKNTPLPPFPFDAPEFAAAWRTWEEHRRQIKHPLKPAMVESQFKMLAGIGLTRAVAMLEHTVAMGWQGLREPQPGEPTHKPRSRLPTKEEDANWSPYGNE